MAVIGIAETSQTISTQEFPHSVYMLIISLSVYVYLCIFRNEIDEI